MNSKKVTRIVLTILAVQLFAFSALAATQAVRIAIQAQKDCLPFWLAKELGWDKEEGIDMELILFDSGMAMLNTLPAKEWDVGVGGVGLMAGLRYNAYVIGKSSDDGQVTKVFVRKDSPILSVKGHNPEYPNIYGDPECVAGKTFLTTTVSTAHYALSNWLDAIGLSDADVVINNMDQAQVITAFENGIGDAMAVWSPFSNFAEKAGWLSVGSGKDTGTNLGCWIYADSEFCDADPELVGKVLRVYSRGSAMLRDAPVEEAMPYLHQFMLDWGGVDLDDDMLKSQLTYLPAYNIQEQLEMLNADNGVSPAQMEMQKFAKFMERTEMITPEEYESVLDMKFVTDKFLRKVRLPIPSYK